MKKLIVEVKWKRFLRLHARNQASAGRRYKDWRKEANRSRIGRARPRVKVFRNTTTFAAPEILSIVLNPDETVKFLKHVQRERRNANVFVDLKSVRHLTPDAIAALLATVELTDAPGNISGNIPSDVRLAEMLEASGFFDHVRRGGKAAKKPSLGAITRQMTRGNKKFDQYLAQELILFALRHFNSPKRAHPPTYSVFGEAMLNTVYHARGGASNPEPWWASVYCDDLRRRACFTFIDQGVGIFESQKLRMQLKVLQGLRLLTRAKLLERIMHGKVPSSSKIKGRGNGLPGMFRHCKAGRVHELRILANNVLGDAEGDVYTVLGTSFAGTILYWEIDL